MSDEGLVRLALLASAIAGCPVSVAEAEPGEPSWTDGATVFVDPTLDERDRRRAVAVQGALLAAGSLAPDVVGGLDRRAPLLRRYLAIEGQRALATSEAVLPPVVRSLVDPSVSGKATSPAESLAVARTREPVDDPPAVFGAIHPRRVRATAAPDAGDGAAHHVPRPTREEVQRELDDGEDTTREGAIDLLNPVGGAGALGRLLQRFLGTSRSTGSGSPGAEAATHRSRRGGRTSGVVATSTSRVDLAGGVLSIERGATTYPEWDVHRHRYRPGWCTVAEVAPTESPSDRGGTTGAPALRRSLARLGLDLERRRRQLQGDDIDLDAAVEARVEVAAGSAPDDALYVDTVRNRRELSVLVLLDISGSAGEPSGSGRTVHDHQRATAAALVQSLHELGDRVALLGFRSQGRTAVQVLPVKRFDERFDARTLRRLDGLVPGAYTRLGAAIRHGSAVLEEEGGTARRLLVVLSDGFAYDHGYEGAYAEADARRALAEARHRGTACLCLSVGAGTDAAALRRVFGTAAHASFRTVDRLPATAGPLFRSALRLAEVQRRAHQRNERTRERLHVERRSA